VTTYNNADELFKARAQARKQKAQLPFEEKLKVVERLQRESCVVAKASGRMSRKPWHCSDEEWRAIGSTI